MVKDEKKKTGKGANAADVDSYFNQIVDVTKQYRNLVDRLSKMTMKRHAIAIADLLVSGGGGSVGERSENASR